jgi:hypothetical protein
MSSAKTISTMAALIVALSSYALAQGSLDAGGTGGAVESSRSAVNVVPSTVDRVPSAVESVPSAVESARSAVEASTPRRGFSSRSSNARQGSYTILER